MDADTKAILQNIIGGVLTSLLALLWVSIWERIRRYHLHRVIGSVLKKDVPISIVYSQLALPPINNAAGALVTHPYIKKPRGGGPVPLVGTYSIENPASECEVRGSTYIAQLVGESSNTSAKLIPDFEAIKSCAGNVVSLGGPGSNYKTADVLAAHTNIFLSMHHTGFVLNSGQTLPYAVTNQHDHGFILRIRSPNFPDCVWIACAGLGEWGTSGSAWFLSRKWRELMSMGDSWRTAWGFLRQPDFVAIVRVVPGQDDSASLVAYYQEQKGQLRRLL